MESYASPFWTADVRTFIGAERFRAVRVAANTAPYERSSVYGMPVPQLEAVTSSPVTARSLRGSLGVSSSLTIAWVVVLLSKPHCVPPTGQRLTASGLRPSSPRLPTRHGSRLPPEAFASHRWTGWDHWQIWSARFPPHFVVLFDQPWRSGERRGVFYMSAAPMLAETRQTLTDTALGTDPAAEFQGLGANSKSTETQAVVDQIDAEISQAASFKA